MCDWYFLTVTLSTSFIICSVVKETGQPNLGFTCPLVSIYVRRAMKFLTKPSKKSNVINYFKDSPMPHATQKIQYTWNALSDGNEECQLIEILPTKNLGLWN